MILFDLDPKATIAQANTYKPLAASNFDDCKSKLIDEYTDPPV
jgi:hypothetical protein